MLETQTHTAHSSGSGRDIHSSSHRSDQAALPSLFSQDGLDLKICMCHIACETVCFDIDPTTKIGVVQTHPENYRRWSLANRRYTSSEIKGTRQNQSLAWMDSEATVIRPLADVPDAVSTLISTISSFLQHP